MEEQKKIRKPDRRVVKTQKAIREALISLMEEKSMDKITMKEIAERADVDRKTVYNYYSGIHEIREALEEELIQQFETAMSEIDCGLDEPYVLFAGMTRVLQENMALYDRIVSMKHNQQMIYKIVAFLKEKVHRALEVRTDVSEEKKEMVATYLTMGIVAVYYQWFDTGKKQPLKELSRGVNTLAMKGVLEFLKEEQ
jgi:AcrR family transcriptional regulator